MTSKDLTQITKPKAVKLKINKEIIIQRPEDLDYA